jgi:hypothetical protein
MVVADIAVLYHSADNQVRGARNRLGRIEDEVRTYFGDCKLLGLPAIDDVAGWHPETIAQLDAAHVVLLVGSDPLVQTLNATCGGLASHLRSQAIVAMLVPNSPLRLQLHESRQGFIHIETWPCASLPIRGASAPQGFVDRFAAALDSSFLALQTDYLEPRLNPASSGAVPGVLNRDHNDFHAWQEFYLLKSRETQPDSLIFGVADWKDLYEALRFALLPKLRFREALDILVREKLLRTRSSGLFILDPSPDSHPLERLFDVAAEPARAIALAAHLCRQAALRRDPLERWLDSVEQKFRLSHEFLALDAVTRPSDMLASCVLRANADGERRAEIYRRARSGDEPTLIESKSSATAEDVRQLLEAAWNDPHVKAAVSGDQVVFELYLDASLMCSTATEWNHCTWRIRDSALGIQHVAPLSWNHPVLLRPLERLDAPHNGLQYVPSHLNAQIALEEHPAPGNAVDPGKFQLLRFRPGPGDWPRLLEDGMLFAVFPLDDKHKDLSSDLSSLRANPCSVSPLGMLPRAFRDWRSASDRTGTNWQNWHLFFDDPSSRISLAEVNLSAC